MAVQPATIKGITSVVAPSQAGLVEEVLVTFTLPVTGGADTCQMGGNTANAGLFGLTGSPTMVAILQAFRRDGKTITLVDRGGAVGEAGLNGSTLFYGMTWAISGSNLTFNCTNAAGSQIAAANGVGINTGDRPITARVMFTVT
jgi:hypothetical protein